MIFSPFLNSKNPPKEIAHCLDGLEELSAFMAPRPRINPAAQRNGLANTSASYLSPPVERAYAADELENGKYTSTPKTLPPVQTSSRVVQPNKGSKSMSEQEVKSEFVRTLKDSEGSNDDFVMVEEENASESQTMLMTASILNDLNQSSSNASVSSTNGGSSFTHATSYECPEYPRIAQKVIGTRLEVELVEMRHHEGEEDKCSSLGSDYVPSANPQGERRDSNWRESTKD